MRSDKRRDIVWWTYRYWLFYILTILLHPYMQSYNKECRCWTVSVWRYLFYLQSSKETSLTSAFVTVSYLLSVTCLSMCLRYSAAYKTWHMSVYVWWVCKYKCWQIHTWQLKYNACSYCMNARASTYPRLICILRVIYMEVFELPTGQEWVINNLRLECSWDLLMQNKSLSLKEFKSVRNSIIQAGVDLRDAMTITVKDVNSKTYVTDLCSSRKHSTEGFDARIKNVLC